MFFVASFLVGAFLINAVPHLAAGLQGAAFPTPFARPRGVGASSALVNVLWGCANLTAGLLMASAFPLVVGFNAGFAAAVAGGLSIAIYLARHFSAVRRGGNL